MATKRRVFISYSRKDGTAAAQRLSELLQEAGCEVWLDTANIRGGASWSKEIEAALNDCDVLVAVLTPASYVSEICRAEQIWALDEGKLVIPVLAVAGAPRAHSFEEQELAQVSRAAGRVAGGYRLASRSS